MRTTQLGKKISVAALGCRPATGISAHNWLVRANDFASWGEGINTKTKKTQSGDSLDIFVTAIELDENEIAIAENNRAAAETSRKSLFLILRNLLLSPLSGNGKSSCTNGDLSFSGCDCHLYSRYCNFSPRLDSSSLLVAPSKVKNSPVNGQYNN